MLSMLINVMLIKNKTYKLFDVTVISNYFYPVSMSLFCLGHSIVIYYTFTPTGTEVKLINFKEVA